ncbi:dihydrolipoamide acetyltransferase family protein [Rhizohabitans arisaemae]|uniref:dihydrolipoamide acetyltransferase family protein n=1 Tax=Rhizohabitans arisaemae TaxID=2720610 RepID=UPI0024B2011B|nr:dihydrolipoamide acetyltransferase family protein [Rhizohabitans arisaemae]
MIKEFKLPDVGEGLTEAEIVKWHVRTGDTVEINQTIVEIETAKAIVELPSPYEGVVTALHVAEGQTVDVGTPIIAVDVSGGESAPPPAADTVPAPRDRTPPAKEERQPVLVGYGVKAGATTRRPRKPAPGAPAEPVRPMEPVAVTPPSAVARPEPTAVQAAVLAKPPVRKLAKDLGVDLRAVVGTGPQGSITRDDVRGAVGPAAVPAFRPGAGREERIPIKGVRRHTAAAMVASAFTAPHVTEFLQVDVTETMEAVRRLRGLAEFEDVKVSPLLLVANALLVAVKRYPMVNSSWDGDDIVVKHYVNLGIAAAVDRGLVVPNIKDAHTLSLPELARALNLLTETARAGRTQPAEMSGGTITITNVGVFGVDAGTPIINPGEAAILAVGQIRKLPWVVDDEIKPRQVCTLALSFDHRVVDGQLGSYVLRDVGAMLEDPLRMLVWG